MGTGKFNKFDNNKKRFNNDNRRSNEEYEARKAAQLEQQGKNLDVIEDIAAFLDNWLMSTDKKSNRVTMKEILNELNKLDVYGDISRWLEKCLAAVNDSPAQPTA